MVNRGEPIENPQQFLPAKSDNEFLVKHLIVMNKLYLLLNSYLMVIILFIQNISPILMTKFGRILCLARK